MIYAKCCKCGIVVGTMESAHSAETSLNAAFTKRLEPADFYLFCEPCGDQITRALDILKQEPKHFWSKPPAAVLPNTNSILDEILRRTKQHNLDRNKQAPQKEVINTQKEEPINIAFEQLMKESGL